MGAEPHKLWMKATLASLPPLLAGIAAGVFLAWHAGRLLQNEVEGVNPGDPVTIILSHWRFLSRRLQPERLLRAIFCASIRLSYCAMNNIDFLCHRCFPQARRPRSQGRTH